MTPQIDLRRVFLAAARMQVGEARHVISTAVKALEAEMEVPQPTEGEKHYAKREKSIRRTKAACDRVLKYAKHETLRNIERHFRATSAIQGAEGPKPGLAARLTFKRPDFTAELLAALREEALSALQVAGQQLFDEVGRDDPWTMPGSDSTAFLDVRDNLLANVSDEIHAEVMASIQDGLEHGETRRELMSRIASKFDEISDGRAKTIANTETSAAFNYARDKAMREAGVTHKKWLHSMSPDIKEPRPTHLAANGQTVPIDEPFDVDGVKFMYPMDESLGAGPEDVINCFCVSVAV